MPSSSPTILSWRTRLRRVYTTGDWVGLLVVSVLALILYAMNRLEKTVVSKLPMVSLAEWWSSTIYSPGRSSKQTNGTPLLYMLRTISIKALGFVCSCFVFFLCWFGSDFSLALRLPWDQPDGFSLVRRVCVFYLYHFNILYTNRFSRVPGITQCPIPSGGSFTYNVGASFHDASTTQLNILFFTVHYPAAIWHILLAFSFGKPQCCLLMPEWEY